MVIGTGVASYLIDAHTSPESIDRLGHLALNDGLTGMPDRAHFSEYLDRELERSQDNGWTIPVLSIDLNHFKEVNDLFQLGPVRKGQACDCDLPGPEFLCVGDIGYILNRHAGLMTLDMLHPTAA